MPLDNNESAKDNISKKILQVLDNTATPQLSYLQFAKTLMEIQDNRIKYNIDVAKDYLSQFTTNSYLQFPTQHNWESVQYITAVQILLESKGYEVGIIDGVLRNHNTSYDKSNPDSKTTQAVLQFQKDYNQTASTKIAEDGIPGPETVKALLEEAPIQTDNSIVVPTAEDTQQPETLSSEQLTQGANNLIDQINTALANIHTNTTTRQEQNQIVGRFILDNQNLFVTPSSLQFSLNPNEDTDELCVYTTFLQNAGSYESIEFVEYETDDSGKITTIKVNTLPKISNNSDNPVDIGSDTLPPVKEILKNDFTELEKWMSQDDIQNLVHTWMKDNNIPSNIQGLIYSFDSKAVDGKTGDEYTSLCATLYDDQGYTYSIELKKDHNTQQLKYEYDEKEKSQPYSTEYYIAQLRYHCDDSEYQFLDKIPLTQGDKDLFKKYKISVGVPSGTSLTTGNTSYDATWTDPYTGKKESGDIYFSKTGNNITFIVTEIQAKECEASQQYQQAYEYYQQLIDASTVVLHTSDEARAAYHLASLAFDHHDKITFSSGREKDFTTYIKVAQNYGDEDIKKQAGDLATLYENYTSQ